MFVDYLFLLGKTKWKLNETHMQFRLINAFFVNALSVFMFDSFVMKIPLRIIKLPPFPLGRAHTGN